MIVIEKQYSCFKNETVDRLNDLATRAIQKVQSMPIVDLYTEHPIFRINSKNLHIQFKEFDEEANLIRQATYAYDALGRRIEKVVTDLQIPANNKTRRYVYDGEDILKVFDENNQVISKYTHSSLRVDDALAIDNKQDNKSYYFLKDHLGSIIDIVNDDLSFKQHYAYSSFGELQKVTDIGGSDITSNPILEHHFAYTGREYDQESGLYHYRARAYDASTGRFLQVDPHPGKTGFSLSVVNKYIYGANSPTGALDPSGKFIFAAMLIGAAIGGYMSYQSGGNILEGMLIGAAAGVAGGTAGVGVGLMAGGGLAGAIGGYNAYDIMFEAGFESTGLFDTIGCGIATGAFAFGTATLVGAAAALSVAAAPVTGGASLMIYGAALFNGAIIGGSAGYLKSSCI